jgi:hypothetical protein
MRDQMTRCPSIRPISPWTGSNRNRGRLQIVRLDGIKSECLDGLRRIPHGEETLGEAG